MWGGRHRGQARRPSGAVAGGQLRALPIVCFRLRQPLSGASRLPHRHLLRRRSSLRARRRGVPLILHGGIVRRARRGSLLQGGARTRRCGLGRSLPGGLRGSHWSGFSRQHRPGPPGQYLRGLRLRWGGPQRDPGLPPDGRGRDRGGGPAGRQTGPSREIRGHPHLGCVRRRPGGRG